MTTEELAQRVDEELTVIKQASLLAFGAIVGALAVRRIVDPRDVANWAQALAIGQNQDTAPETRARVSAALGAYSTLLRAMIKEPGAPESGADAPLTRQ